MTATALTTAKPPWAITAWADDNAVYVEIPSPSGPYITRYPFTESGLSKALWLMRSHYVKHRPVADGPSKVSRHAKVRDAKPSKFTQESRDRALDILKKAGVIK